MCRARTAAKRELGTVCFLRAGRREISAGITKMHEARDTAIYRVSSRTPGCWEVFQDSDDAPVASFADKSAALTYAMDLARGHVSWQLLATARHSQARL